MCKSISELVRKGKTIIFVYNVAILKLHFQLDFRVFPIKTRLFISVINLHNCRAILFITWPTTSQGRMV